MYKILSPAQMARKGRGRGQGKGGGNPLENGRRSGSSDVEALECALRHAPAWAGLV